MNDQQPNNPLHGVTLAAILEFLVKEYGWQGLGGRIDIKCFNEDPSIKSSLKFLRTTEWARKKVEELYVKTVARNKRKKVANESDDPWHYAKVRAAQAIERKAIDDRL